MQRKLIDDESSAQGSVKPPNLGEWLIWNAFRKACVQVAALDYDECLDKASLSMKIDDLPLALSHCFRGEPAEQSLVLSWMHHNGYSLEEGSKQLLSWHDFRQVGADRYDFLHA